jgi:hypothetical protein
MGAGISELAKQNSSASYRARSRRSAFRRMRHWTRAFLATTTILDVFTGAACVLALLAAGHALVATVFHLAA